MLEIVSFQSQKIWGFNKETYPGIKPITAPHPIRMPQTFPSARSTRYALLFALVRIFSSFGVNPGGSALRLFLVVLYSPPSLVAGIVSK